MKQKFYRSTPILVAFSLSSLVTSLSAQIVWDGDTDTDFANGSNWVGDIAPADDTVTDIAQFNGAAANQPDLSTGDRGVNGVDFQTGGWTLSGTNILSIGSGGITSTGNNTISAQIAQTGGATYSSAAGGQLNLDIISGGPVTFGSAGNTGEVVLNGAADNPSFSPVVAFGTVVANKGTGGGGDSGSSANNITVNTGATLQFGSNLTSRGAGGGRGQIFGSATVDGTLDLNGQGLTRADTNNWSMATFQGGGIVTNNGTGSAEITVVVGGGTFNGNIVDGTSTTALRVRGSWTLNSAASTYSGGTIVENGAELRIQSGGTDRLGTGVLTLDSGGYIKNVNNNQVLNNDVVIGSGGGGVEVGWNDRRIELHGTVSGDGLFTVRNDSSSVRLINSNNNYTGGTEIQSFVNANSGALGTGPVTLNDVDGNNTRGFIQNLFNADRFDNDLIIHANGGRMQAGWNSDLEFRGVTSGTGELRIAGDSGVVVLSNNANTFSGDIVLEAANSRLKLGSLESGSYTGTISGDGTIEFAGTGTQVLTSSSTITYTGSTVVDSGNLQVDTDTSSTAMFVRDGATVSGTGILGITNIEAGGTIAPGQSPGTITTADFTLQALANYDAEIDGTTAGTGHDQIVVIGAVNLAGNLNVALSGSYVFGDEVILIENDGADAINGPFNGLNEGDTAVNFGGFDWIASYTAGDGNDFSLTAVPEPSSCLLAALGALALIRRRRA